VGNKQTTIKSFEFHTKGGRIPNSIFVERITSSEINMVGIAIKKQGSKSLNFPFQLMPNISKLIEAQLDFGNVEVDSTKFYSHIIIKHTGKEFKKWV